MPKPQRVIVVGAGVAGLVCAKELFAAGVEVVLIDAADDLGGRVRTDEVDGYLLDRGFQIFLPSYPEAKRQLDYRTLDLCGFEPGALVFRRGGFHRLSDPWKRPVRALSTAVSSIGSVMDKVRIARLRSAAKSETAEGLFAGYENSAASTLTKSFGFSEAMMETFLRPFFGGIFLDRNLLTSDRFLFFVFQMFSEQAAALPSRGMQEIVRRLAEFIPTGAVRLNTSVKKVASSHVVTDEELRIEGDAVVLAVDGTTASKLADDEAVCKPKWNGTSCVYFAADEAPIDEPILMLNGEPGEGPVNLVAVLSNVASTYAPAGKALVSVSTIGNPKGSDEALLRAVLLQLKGWFGTKVDSWRHLRTYRIPNALPEFVPPTIPPQDRELRLANGVYLCGDHWSAPSLQHAMASGRRVAESILGKAALSSKLRE